MKELIGKIYRDENGVETIERESKKSVKVLWDVELEADNGRPHPYGLSMRCPECGNVYVTAHDSIEARRHYANKLHDLRYNRRYTYCGFCGHRNIVEVEI